MFRIGAAAVLIICLGSLERAQAQPIQWISNSQQGVAKARSSGKPIMFYITSGSQGDKGDLKQDQQRAFRDPLVSSLARERFVPVRLANSSDTEKMLSDMGAPRGGDQLVFSSPTGDYIGAIGPGQIRDAKSLAKGMVQMFRTYRDQVFNKDLKPVLENLNAPPGDVLKALNAVEELLILSADQTVADVLKREDLATTTAKKVYSTLATLSTPASVKALLEAAPNDKQAELALDNCTPAGAEEMLTALDLEKPDALIPAYEAVTKICKVKGKKPRGFWNGDNQQLMAEELERVKEEVKGVSKRWKKKYEDYR